MTQAPQPELTDDERYVMFEGGTEPPFSGELVHEHRSGGYYCRNCGTLLFTSDTKFDSGSGWPSFSYPENRENVILLDDTSHGMTRTEVKCATCDAHLGHVFDDGPMAQGGLRYCVNSLSLSFAEKAKD